MSALLAVALGLSAETWYVDGSWEYYAMCDASYRPDFRTASNSIEVWRDLGDGRVIIRSTARMVDARRGAALPVAPPAGMEGSLDPWYPRDESKATALRELAASIVGDAPSAEAAVDRLNAWIRDKVSYSLGASTDPLDVARTGLAFCDGYASLAVALFRAVGIPAVKLTCYVPPGNDWGSGNSGGDHAFFAYFYPGIGWICCDPQSTSGYVDPFHLVGFKGKIHVQYRRPPDALVTGFDEEPKSWTCYSSAGGNNGARGFALRMLDPDGKTCDFTASFAVSGKSLSPSRAYFKKNMLGQSWRAAGGGEGIVINADAERLAAFLAGSGWRSFFALPGTWPESGMETLALRSSGMLALRQVDLGAPAFAAIELAFSEGRSQGIRLRDPAGGAPLAKRAVKIRADGIELESSTSADGWLYLSFLDSRGAQRRGLEVTASIGGSEYSFAYEPGTAIALPGQEGREASLQAALAEARAASSKPRFRLIVRDLVGAADASIVGAASLFDGATERRLTARGPLFLAADGLEAGKSYVLRARVGKVEVQRLIGPVSAGEGSELELRQAELRPLRLWRENPLDAMDFKLYEYFDDEANPWPLAGADGRVLWDCPEGEYLVSDNVIRANVARLAVEGKKDLDYAPGGFDLEAYRFAEAFRLEREGIVVARARDASGCLRSGSMLIADEAGLSPRNLEPNDRGFFSCAGLKPSTSYRLAFAAPGKLALRTFSTDEKGAALLDLELSGETIPCATDDARSRAGTDRVMLLVPAASEKEAVLRAFALKTGNRFELYADRGGYLLSTESTIMGASSIAAGEIDGRRDGSGTLRLAPDRGEAGYLERSRRLASLAWPASGDLVFLGFRDAVAQGWKSASVGLTIGSSALGARFDSQGFLQIKAPAGSELSFRYSRRGLDWEGRAAIDHPGPAVVELSPDESRSARIQVKDSARLWIAAPSRQNGRTKLEYRSLEADERGLAVIEGPGKGAWIKTQDGAMRFCAFDGGLIKSWPAQDQAKAWKSLLEDLFPGTAQCVLDLRALGKGVESRLRDGAGSALSSWSPSEGILIFSDLTDGELAFEAKRDGLVLRQAVRIGGPGAYLIAPQAQSPSVTLKLAGPAEKTRNAFVRLYSGGTMEGTAIKGFKERIEARASADGRIACALPDGLWWIEAAGRFKKVTVKSGASQAVSLQM